jgi:ubiquitin C-terminal hydrolase
MGQIAELMKLVRPSIDLKSMFNSSAIEINPTQQMMLRGLVCYYGRHYVAFSFSVSFQTWLMFDDANVVEVGPTFETVVQKCIKSTYQPSLLFYETSI